MPRIYILAEGATEGAMRNHLKAFIDQRAGAAPKVGIEIRQFGGGLKESSVKGQSEEYLKSPDTWGVIALTDVYPAFKNATQARQIIGNWFPTPVDPRCHVHVAQHDFEAWLLVGWPNLLKKARSGSKQPWGANPEQVNGNNPPAHRVSALFDLAGKKYKKPIDGKQLFEQLDLLQVAAACPNFKLFLNCILTLAKYSTIP